MPDTAASNFGWMSTGPPLQGWRRILCQPTVSQDFGRGLAVKQGCRGAPEISAQIGYACAWRSLDPFTGHFTAFLPVHLNAMSAGRSIWPIPGEQEVQPWPELPGFCSATAVMLTDPTAVKLQGPMADLRLKACKSRVSPGMSICARPLGTARPMASAFGRSPARNLARQRHRPLQVGPLSARWPWAVHLGNVAAVGHDRLPRFVK